MQTLLEDIRERFSNMEFVHGDARFSVTLSVGIAALKTYLEPATLLAEADSALYVAKHNGRNQVRVATPPIRSKASP